MKINTILTPKDIFKMTEGYSVSATIFIVIDVLRASTTICAALFNGAKEIIPFSSIKQAKEFYKNNRKKNLLLCGERNGIKPSGFDYGNSPLEFIARHKETHKPPLRKGGSFPLIRGKRLIMTTTNCTKVLMKIKSEKNVLIGCFSNFTRILSVISNKWTEISSRNPNNLKQDSIEIKFICSGNEGKPSLEDSVCSGAFVNSLVNRYDNCYLNEGSRIAMETFLNLKNKLKKSFYSSEHGSRLRELGFEKDIDLALMYDIFPVIPALKGNKIIPIF